MAWKATHDLVARVMPLIEHLAESRYDKAVLLQYLAAQVAAGWGIMEVVADQDGPEGRQLVFRDRLSGAEHALRCPAALTPDLERLVVAEYQRLAVDTPLTSMDPVLFDRLFELTHCARCRWRGEEHTQIQAECRFAGYPINFEP
jgi:hypothetical protein